MWAPTMAESDLFLVNFTIFSSLLMGDVTKEKRSSVGF